MKAKSIYSSSFFPPDSLKDMKLYKVITVKCTLWLVIYINVIYMKIPQKKKKEIRPIKVTSFYLIGIKLA